MPMPISIHYAKQPNSASFIGIVTFDDGSAAKIEDVDQALLEGLPITHDTLNQPLLVAAPAGAFSPGIANV